MAEQFIRSGGDVLRVATWNLERPPKVSFKKDALRAEVFREVDADIWILTETRASIVPNSEFHFVPAEHNASESNRAGRDELWVAIWSRWKPHRICGATHNLERTVCASVETPLGPLVVYGTVLPWAHDRGKSGDRRLWAEFEDDAPKQAQEWKRLREMKPDHHICVAGDFNHSLDGVGRYFTRRGRQLLNDGLKNADLVCATRQDFVASGQLKSRSSVDHICVSVSLKVIATHAWEGFHETGVRLSDHNGVAVDLAAG